jgi:hypothetical protein
MATSLRPEVDARDFARVTRILRSIDKDLIADLRAPMKEAIAPLAKMVVNRANSFPVPMSGMSRPGPKQFAPVFATTHITPGFSRKNPNLVEIKIKPTGGAGMFIADMAGRVSAGKSPQGMSMIRTLNTVVPGWHRGGRYIYRAFMPYRQTLYNLANNILNRWVDGTNRKLEGL